MLEVSLGYFAHSNTDSKEQVKSSLWSLYSPGLSWKQQEAILKPASIGSNPGDRSPAQSSPLLVRSDAYPAHSLLSQEDHRAPTWPRPGRKGRGTCHVPGEGPCVSLKALPPYQLEGASDSSKAVCALVFQHSWVSMRLCIC